MPLFAACIACAVPHLLQAVWGAAGQWPPVTCLLLSTLVLEVPGGRAGVLLADVWKEGLLQSKAMGATLSCPLRSVTGMLTGCSCLEWGSAEQLVFLPIVLGCHNIMLTTINTWSFQHCVIFRTTCPHPLVSVWMFCFNSCSFWVFLTTAVELQVFAAKFLRWALTIFAVSCTAKFSSSDRRSREGEAGPCSVLDSKESKCCGHS